MPMSSVLAGAVVDEHIARGAGQPKDVVEFPIWEQAAIGGDPAPWNSSLIRRSKSTRRGCRPGAGRHREAAGAGADDAQIGLDEIAHV